MVPLLMAVTWFVWKEIPLNWNNTLFVDFKNEKIKIYPRRLNRKEQGILDFDGMQISFNEINFYSAEVYDSFIFSSYYLVTVNVNHKTIKCISFKEADKYTDFLKIMSELGIQLKENNSSHK